jgi:AcrR family transcriptional regulator
VDVGLVLPPQPSGHASTIKVVADPVAIVSVVSGAAVAIGVPFINGQLERRRVEQKSRDARLEELRGLLDAAVQHLYKAWATMFDIEQEGQKELPGPDWDPKRLRQLGETLTAEVDEIVQDGLRVSLRTPSEARISAAHTEAQRIFLRYEAECRTYLQSGLIDQEKPPRAPTGEAAGATAAFVDEIRNFAGVVGPQPSTVQTSS